MQRRKRRRSDRAGRPAMRSPGRPPATGRAEQQRFWKAIARGLSSEDAAVSCGVSPVFVWAVVGLIRPTWARLPSRAASVGVWVLSVVLFIIGGALMPDSTPEQTEQSAALGSQSVPPPTPEAVAAPATDERVHPESDFQAQVQRLIQQRPLGGDTTEARAFHNDLTLTVNREASALLASTTCDQQRDLAASVWLKWSEMDVGRGAGVTIQSYTGRILASAEEGFTGPQFHCD